MIIRNENGITVIEADAGESIFCGNDYIGEICYLGINDAVENYREDSSDAISEALMKT